MPWSMRVLVMLEVPSMETLKEQGDKYMSKW
jgi:hypothetical protein